MWKMRYYPYYYRPPIEWTAIRTWSELGKKRSNTLKQWPTNCHVIQCCEVCRTKEGKIPNKHTGIIQNTTYFFSSDTILKYNLKKNRFPYYLLILLAFSSLTQHSAVITLDSWQPMVGVGPWWKMIGYARSIHIYIANQKSSY